MNYPLLYRGETFYQAGFRQGERAMTLQVGHSPSFITRSVACIIVPAGLLIQFGYLVGFARQRRAVAA